MGSPFLSAPLLLLVVSACLLLPPAAPAPQPFRRDPGHPQWHHGAFHDVQDTIRADVRRMLHSRAEVPFQVPLEVNVVLVGFNGDGGYRYALDAHKLEGFLKASFPTHRPSCLETGEPIDIEHHVVYNVIPSGQPELIAIEKTLKEAMTPAGNARESEYGRELPVFEVDAVSVEPIFQRLYSYIFDVESGGYSATEMDRPVPSAIFITNFDKVRIDPRNKETDHDSLMDGEIKRLTEEELKKQEGGYIYQYRYNGGGASQVWLSSGRFVVIDLSAGPCVYGKIETEEGSVSYRTVPRLWNLIFPGGSLVPSVSSTYDIFMGQLGALVSTTIEYVVAPDVRFETVDLTRRLLIPIIVLQNHNRNNR
uniref:Phosphonates import ATP-binding protein PhnC 2 n=1 Tax=Anthurium amnicola TaxID=1678845 RepID=A0A1D1Z394_9ARAE